MVTIDKNLPKRMVVVDPNTGLPIVIGGASDFTDLNDTPSSYAGAGGRLLAVNSAETGVEFSNIEVLQFKGTIDLPADFPTLAEVQNGWVYRITTDVTDNDVTKTNTGQSFVVGEEIAWNGTDWSVLGSPVGLSIGDSISGGSDQRVLFLNGDALAQDSQFLYDDTINQLKVGQFFFPTQVNAIYTGKFFAREASTSASLGTCSVEYNSGADLGIIRTTKETGPANTFDDFEIRMTDATFGNHQVPFLVSNTNGQIVINSTTDLDVRIAATGNTNAIFVDDSTGEVGIGTASVVAGRAVTIGGDAEISTGDFRVSAGQVLIGTGTIDTSAAFQIKSTTQGFLPSKMTETQRDAIGLGTANGLQLYNTDLNAMQVFNGVSWDTVQSRTNYVLVREKADFPAPAAGVITLADDTLYEINGTINLGTDRIEAGDESVVRGQNQAVDTILYTGTGSMFTSTDSTLFIETLTASAPAGTVFSGTNVAQNEFYIIRNVIVANSSQVSSITGFNTILIEETLQQGNSQGWQFNGTLHLALNSNLLSNWAQAAGTNFFEITGGTVGILTLETNIFNPETNETAIDIDPSATVEQFLCTGNNFVGEADGGTYLSGDIDPNNSNYTITNNRGLPDYSDNVSRGSMLMEGNPTVTTITAINAWVKVAGTTIAGGNELRYSMNTDNELTYDGARTVGKTVFVSLDAERSGGTGNIDYEFTVFQNGSKVANVTAFLETNAQAKGVAFQAPVTAAAGDTFEVFVRNTLNTTNVSIANMQVSIS